MRWYVRQAPIRKGKTQLVQLARLLERRTTFNLLAEVQPNIWMELDLRSHIERRIYYFGFYRTWVLPYFDELLADGQTVIDVGANVGQFTLWAAARVGPSGTVLAFEPEQTCFKKLVRNIQLNGTNTIRAECAAITDFDGEAALYLNDKQDDNQGQSSLTRFGFHHLTQAVRCLRLDTFISREQIEGVHILKIDTQGAEMQVLKGASHLIEQDHPAILLRCHEEKCQAVGESTVNIQRFLLDRGYDLFEIHWKKGRIPVTTPYIVDDATFVALKEK